MLRKTVLVCSFKLGKRQALTELAGDCVLCFCCRPAVIAMAEPSAHAQLIVTRGGKASLPKASWVLL